MIYFLAFLATFNFLEEMGNNTPLWEHVQTEEDLARAEHFNQQFDQLSQIQKSNAFIPKTLHFIWLGPKDFPKTSLANIESWLKHHPNWTLKFWSDRSRSFANPRVDLQLIEDYPFASTRELYYDSDNYAERADLLRYEILKNEGGVYVDHDVICFKSFEPLTSEYDFFCALEPPHPVIVNSAITLCNNVIGATPHHPIFDSVLGRVHGNWEKIKRIFPGSDRESTQLRVANRTFSAFDLSVRHELDAMPGRNAVLPASFFNQLKGLKPQFAHHTFDGTWYKDEDPFQMLVRKELKKMARKSNRMLLISGISAGLNLLLIGYILIRRRRYAI